MAMVDMIISTILSSVITFWIYSVKILYYCVMLILFFIYPAGSYKNIEKESIAFLIVSKPEPIIDDFD